MAEIHIEDRCEACCEEALELLKGGIAGDISGILAVRHDLTQQEARDQIAIAKSVVTKILTL